LSYLNLSRIKLKTGTEGSVENLKIIIKKANKNLMKLNKNLKETI